MICKLKREHAHVLSSLNLLKGIAIGPYHLLLTPTTIAKLSSYPPWFPTPASPPLRLTLPHSRYPNPPTILTQQNHNSIVLITK